MTVSTDIVNSCRPLRGLSEPAHRALAEVAREVRFRRDERLIPLGQPPQRLLILVDGLAKLVGVSANGHERILYVYRPGDLVGPTVLLDNFRHDYEVTAMSPVRALAVSRRELLMVGRQHPSIIVAVAQEVSRLLVAMTERVMAATSAEVPVRLSQLLLEFSLRNGGPGNGGSSARDRATRDDGHDGLVPLNYPLTHEVMAQIVGASRPHTSTVLRDLEELGAVQRKSRRGLLVHPMRLAEIVENGATDVLLHDEP
jgi:CRP/FNR family cyclic AMP-dependent transcriptional regulator